MGKDSHSCSAGILWWLLATLILLTSCNTRKYLKPDDKLLVKNKITIIADLAPAERNALKYELQTQLQQTPNDKSFFFFKSRLWFYYRQLEKGDSTDFDKFIQRKIVEPPSLYEEDMSLETVERMEELLFNKGYLEPEIWYQDTLKNQKVYVEYFVKPNRLYTVESYEIDVSDHDLDSLLNSTKSEALLQPGAPVSNSLLGLEKQRIVNQLQDKGYSNFTYGNFGALEATDTSDATVRTRLPILPGQEGGFTRTYVGNVTVNNLFSTDHFSLSEPIYLDSIRFINFDHRNRIKPSVLLKYIELRPGELLRKSDLNETRVQLQLPAIRFADIRSRRRPDNPGIMDFDIDLLPAKRIETSTEFEVNQTVVSSQSFIGIGTSFSLINNNFLGGSERLSNGIDISFEINPKLKGVFNAADFTFHNSLEIPRFADYLGLYRLMNKMNVISDDRMENIRINANTVVTANYEYVALFQFFNYHSLTAQYGFRSAVNEGGRRKRLEIVHPSFTYFAPTIQEQFDSLYSEETFARKSFAPQLFTSIFFNKLTYTLEDFQGVRGFSSAFIGSFELSGAEIYLANLIANGLERPWMVDSIGFASFTRFEVDGRLYKQINQEQALAFRANFGIALPFGNTEVIPYVRQFYLGGPLTMRAWQIRELGPGSYQDTTITRESGNPFFQTGDIKLLFNAEYRFDVFWRIEGALFLDVGNIWTLKPDERTGGVFSSNFLSQMAIGSGAGIRFDADYFKVVLDLGVKLRNPYPDETGRHLALQSGVPASDVLNWNFAINYPF